MPIYAYLCTACGHAQDVLQKISDDVLTVCPACGQPSYAKQVTAAGFQLKGSGWYVTDFRGGNAAGKDKPKDGATEGEKEATKEVAKEGAADAAKDGAKGSPTPADKAPAAAPTPTAEAAKPVAAAPAPTAPKAGA